MTTEQVLGILLLLSMVGMVAVVFRMSMAAQQYQDTVYKIITELQEDNKALVEAAMRAAGKPMIFRKSDPIASEGWFDSKPKMIVKKEA